MTYHFYCLKSCVVLHMENASTSNIRSAVRKSCRSGMRPLVPKNLKMDNSSCLNPTATLPDKGRWIRDIVGSFLPCVIPRLKTL